MTTTFLITHLRFAAGRRRVAGLAAVTVLLAACGSGSGGGSGADQAAGAGVTTSAPADPLLDSLYQGRSQEEVDLEIETEVQTCMTALGWEYTAVARSLDGAGGGLGSAADNAAEIDAFTAQYGYGITTNLDGSVDVSGQAGVGATGAGADDPNAAYVNGLPADQQEAYYNDLYGKPAEPDANGEVVSTGGCYNDATEKVLGPGGFDQMSDQFDKVSELIGADSRVVDATAAWVACMSEAGYSYASPDDPFTDFSDRLAALGQAPAEADLKALQAEELATAKADRACAVKAGVDKAYTDAYADAAAQVAGQ